MFSPFQIIFLFIFLFLKIQSNFISLLLH